MATDVQFRALCWQVARGFVFWWLWALGCVDSAMGIATP